MVVNVEDSRRTSTTIVNSIFIVVLTKKLLHRSIAEGYIAIWCNHYVS